MTKKPHGLLQMSKQQLSTNIESVKSLLMVEGRKRTGNMLKRCTMKHRK